MEQVVILKDAHGAGPFKGRQRGLDRAAQRVVEGQQSRGLAGPKDEVRETFRTIGEGADSKGLRCGHGGEYKRLYGTSSDFGSTFTIHRPELMSGT